MSFKSFLSSNLFRCSRNVVLFGGLVATYKSSKIFFHSVDHEDDVRSQFQKVAARYFPTAHAAVKDKYLAKPISDEEYLDKSEDVRAYMERLIMRVQKEFVQALEAEETGGQKFFVDRWKRRNEKEGGGITCVLQGGDVFEKAGVNVTVMTAPLSPRLQDSMRSRGKDLPSDRKFTFFAAGISSVIHPRNPYVPTVHFNFRYFEIQDEFGENRHSWFGGGADLTPYYLNAEDNAIFHGALKGACDKHGAHRYPEFKKICDNYFYIKARGERRGIGGIFFDDLESEDPMTEFNFVKDCADSIIPSYLPIVKKRKNIAYNDVERDWQLIRRGRYVEFNLVYDRGTKFGFATPGARMESVLVSLPLVAKWSYMHEPEEGSREHNLLKVLRDPVEWV